MAKKLGIDLGSSSLGWFLRENEKVLNKGVITFSEGMVKGQGGYSSPTKDRREARSKRKLIQARKYRKWELLDILIDNDCVPIDKEELEIWSKYKKGTIRKFPESELFKKWLACDFTYCSGIKYKNPYELRVEALDNKLSKHELGRVLYHLVQRRGYKDIGEKDKETKTQIERRGESGFDATVRNSRTIAEALKNDFLDKGKRARNEYPYRAEYEHELIEIMKAQGYDVEKNEKKEYKDEFVKSIRKAIIWQRPLKSQKGNIGKCTLEPTKPRCPASHPIFEIFRAWQYINTIKIIESSEDDNKEAKNIPLDFKKKLFEDVFLKQNKNFKFEKIQKYLDKLYQKRNEYNYLNKSTNKYDSTVSGMPVCKGLINLFGEKIKEEINYLHTYNIGSKDHKVINNYSVYDLWHIIYNTDDDHLEEFAISKLGINNFTKTNNKGEEYSENAIVKLKKSEFSNSYSDLSLKAMCKIIPFLQEGFLYNEAALLAKIPENIDSWESKKSLVYEIIKRSNKIYKQNKDIVFITNSLINKFKASKKENTLEFQNRFITEDKLKVEKACSYYYGEKTWSNKNERDVIKEKVFDEYQSFFNDPSGEYREGLTLTEIIKEQFQKESIGLKGKLYHHSDRANLYHKPLFSNKHNKKILAVPLIDSIKNPMFNKAMSILRKLVNELIIQDYIDKNTEIIIEVASELNDNNKRAAIERYQNERRREREKIRHFIEEFKQNNLEYSSINTEEKIPLFEMWEEQTFEEATDEKGQKIKNLNPYEIRKEKDDIKRYELWLEQKGQCMYTGKMISISNLFSSIIEVEHTIPRSLLPDSTKTNLTVCFSKYNSDIKNNKIPKECPNYNSAKDFEGIGTCTEIEPRLKRWKKLRDHYKTLYNDHSKSVGTEDEKSKNIRIQNKHYYKMHYDYWRDKVDRFTTDEIKESWVRRQLVDTQMVSKYAREFLKTYFNKVLVQKGITTSDFRKIYGIQEEEKKDRSKHTHHCIDAAVLTLIPTNSSKRVQMLEQFYREEEKKQKITRKLPGGFYRFNSKELIDSIENDTLIVNYVKDKITDQTYRNVRKRGKLQYLKDEKGKFIEKNNEKILLKSKGASIRGDLFKSTFIGKIRNVERDSNGKPIKENGTWKYLTDKDEFTYTVRQPIEKAKIENIIDPDIKRLITEQLNRKIDIRKIKDHQGNIIRRVRVKVKAGREVKERQNYKSKHAYKNNYYSAAGEIPYAIFITTPIDTVKLERKMIPIPIHEVAQTFKEYYKFTPEIYLNKFHPEIKNIDLDSVKLLKVGQKVFVLKDDNELEKRDDTTFKMNRFYKITQFYVDGSGGIYLKYHLEATKDSDIDLKIKESKHLYLKKFDDEYGLPEIKENLDIDDLVERKKDYNDRKYRFVGMNNYRFSRLLPYLGEEKLIEIKSELDKYKKQSSKIEKERETPLLKVSSTECNFLFENYDFEMDITGNIKWIDD